jgi:hypothetical protein
MTSVEVGLVARPTTSPVAAQSLMRAKVPDGRAIGVGFPATLIARPVENTEELSAWWCSRPIGGADDFVHRRRAAADPIPQVAHRLQSLVRERHPLTSLRFVAGTFGADPSACREQSVRPGSANPRLGRCRGARVCSR